ncbi:MAG TPA: hypothetical protein VH482_23635 [Thermomicrobiales bacterium]
MTRRWAAIVACLLIVTTLANVGAKAHVAAASTAKKVSLSPASGPVGATVTVFFRRFTKNHSITISWDGKTVATSRTSAGGDGSVSFKAPVAKRGAHTVAATMGAVTDSATFRIVPKISLSRSSSLVGQQINATLRGFGRGESVALAFDSASKTLVSVRTSSVGSASGTFVVPVATGGNHNVLGIGGTGSRTQATLFIKPSAWVSPTSGPPGTNIRVHLRGYAKGELVEIQLRGGGGSQSEGIVTASSTGSVNVTITLKLHPAMHPGDYAIVGRGYGVSVAETPFTVT